MSTYEALLRTERSSDEIFEYLSELAEAAGTAAESSYLTPTPDTQKLGGGASFEIEFAVGGRMVTFHYETMDHEPSLDEIFRSPSSWVSVGGPDASGADPHLALIRYTAKLGDGLRSKPSKHLRFNRAASEAARKLEMRFGATEPGPDVES